MGNPVGKALKNTVEARDEWLRTGEPQQWSVAVQQLQWAVEDHVVAPLEAAGGNQIYLDQVGKGLGPQQAWSGELMLEQCGSWSAVLGTWSEADRAQAEEWKSRLVEAARAVRHHLLSSVSGTGKAEATAKSVQEMLRPVPVWAVRDGRRLRIEVEIPRVDVGSVAGPGAGGKGARGEMYGIRFGSSLFPVLRAATELERLPRDMWDMWVVVHRSVWHLCQWICYGVNTIDILRTLPHERGAKRLEDALDQYDLLARTISSPPGREAEGGTRGEGSSTNPLYIVRLGEDPGLSATVD